MTVMDPIADLLTVIRNANHNRSPQCQVPHAKALEDILKVLQSEGYIEGYQVTQPKEGRPVLVVRMKYDREGTRVIRDIKRVSSSSKRVYEGHENLTPVLDGLGIRVVSTSKGVMSDRKCRELKIGGEVICQVF